MRENSALMHVSPGLRRCLASALVLCGGLAPLSAWAARDGASTLPLSVPSNQASEQILSPAKAAIARARNLQFPVLVIFSLDGCSYCRRLEAETLSQPEVRERLKDFVVIEADFLEEQDLARESAVRGAPAIVRLSPDPDRPPRTLLGYVTSGQLLQFLRPEIDAQALAFPATPGISLPPHLSRALHGPDEDWTEADFLAAMELLHDSEVGPHLRQDLAERKDLPRNIMIGALNHSRLAIRLAALETLEGLTGSDFGFSPWLDDPEANREALLKWQQWADRSVTTKAQEIDWEDAEAAGEILAGLLTGNAARVTRARKALLSGSEPAREALLAFVSQNPQISSEQEARLKEIWFAMLLQAANANEPQEIARRLVDGSLDQRWQALTSVPADRVLEPIYQEFLSSPEPLEREAAIEQLAALGSQESTPTLLEHYSREADENVRHGILRNLGKLDSPGGRSLLADEASSRSEDLAIMALESLAQLEAASEQEAVRAAMQDPRWRVRAAALKTIQKEKFQNFDKEVARLLGDKDEFVRISAIETAAFKKIRGVRTHLEKIFLSQPNLRPPVAEAFARMGEPFPPSLLQEIKNSDPEEILSLLAVIPDADSSTIDLLAWAAEHTNSDIAAKSAQIVATNGLREPPGFALAAQMMESGRQPVIQSLVSQASPSPYTIQRLLPSLKVARFVDPEAKSQSTTWENKTDEESVLRLRKAVREVYDSAEDLALRQNSSILLAALGDDVGIPFLTGQWEDLTPFQRSRLASALGSVRVPEARPLFEILLRTPESNIRRAALLSLLQDGLDAECIRLVLEELVRPQTPLLPSEAFAGHLSSLRHNIEENQRTAAKKLLLEVAKDAGVSLDLRILAHSALQGFIPLPWERQGNSDSSLDSLTAAFLAATNEESPLVRRAAWLGLGEASPDVLRESISRLLNDPSPEVREVVPIFLQKQNREWDVLFEQGNPYSQISFSSRSNEEISKENAALLAELESDPAPRVRRAATLARIMHRLPFNAQNWLDLQREQGDSLGWRMNNLVREVFRQGVDDLPGEYSVLVDLLVNDTNAGNDEERQLFESARKHFDANKFSNEDSEIKNEAAGEPVVAGETQQPPGEARQEGVPIVYFSKPGCGECEQVAAMLGRLKESFPEVKIEEWNINRNQSMEFNEALSRRFTVPENLRLVAPSVFAAGGFLIRDDISEARLGQLVFQSRDRDAGFLRPQQEDLQAASGAIGERYTNIRVSVILAAGLLDGLNPCAFATIIFLLSYLQIARKTGGEILQIGLAYIAGVFTAYFILGLGLTEILSRLVVLHWASTILNLGMAGFALVIGVLSFRDGIRCARGQLGDMTLQLPEALKSRIHGVIRTTARHRRFVVLAFGVGAFISILELACTGQVYAPTILYMMQSGEGRAIGYLVLYNLAFIFPLAVVFALAFAGLTSAHLTTFLKKHAAWVKFGLSALFLVLAALLIQREFFY